MIFTPDGKVIRDIDIDSLNIFFCNPCGKRIELTKDKITYQKAVSQTVADESFSNECFEEKEIPLSFDSFLKISDDVHNSGLLNILQPQTFETMNYYPNMLLQGMRCVFTDGSCYNYIVSGQPLKEFETITKLLLSYFESSQETVSFIEVPKETKTNEDYCQTQCCDVVIPKKWKNCPLCGKYLEESEKKKTSLNYDIDATVWICSECNSGIPAQFSFCGSCGAKRPW